MSDEQPLEDKACLRCFKAKEASKFYKDVKRRDGLDVWCKDCRKEWRKSVTIRPAILSSDDPYQVLTLPPFVEWPKTCHFNSGTRKAADQLVEQGKIVIVTKFRGDDSGTGEEVMPVWFWRKWKQAAFPDIFDFYQWLTTRHLG